MQYNVTIQRIEYREHTFRVEASNPDEAGEIALEESNDYNFLDSPVKHADEEIVSVVLSNNQEESR